MTPLLSWYRSGRRTRESAHALYATLVARARTPALYAELGVPDTLDGRFDMIVLHMFLVLERLKDGGEQGRRLSQALFDLMFQDMDRSLRELGVSDHAIGRRIKQMISAFYGRIQAYGGAVEDPTRLAQALRRNIYRERAVDPGAVARLADYVLATRRDLAAAALGPMLEGTLDLVPAACGEAKEIR